MKFAIDDLKMKINKFFLKEISKEDLGEWAKAAYHNLLKGGYLETKKIICYPFIKVVSTIHVEENDTKGVFPCSRKDIEFIRDVLSGKKNEVYSVDIGFPWKLNCEEFGLHRKKKEQYLKLICILKQYSNNQLLTKEDYEECINALNMEEDRPDTIQSVLDSYIKSFLKKSIDYEEQCLNLQQGMWLYIQKRKTDNEILYKMIKYLECYVGERNISLDISFKSGVSYLTYSV